MGEKQLNKELELKSLRIVEPKLYSMIVDELEDQNIHSYDVQMMASEIEEGIQLVLRYGGSFQHEKRKFFTYDSMKNESEIQHFAQEIGKACEEVLINEYFKMMRP